MGRKLRKWEIPFRNCHYDASILVQTTIICSETSSCQYPHYRQSNTLQLALLLTYNFINPRCRCYSRLGLPSGERWSRSNRRKIVRVTHSYPCNTTSHMYRTAPAQTRVMIYVTFSTVAPLCTPSNLIHLLSAYLNSWNI